ncbi:MAG: ABC transporter substrate-binding protein, partial [Pseudomonadota bacterium]
GADIVDTLFVPVGTRNYIGMLKKIKAMKPQVVATAIGGNDYIPLRAQVVDMGLHQSPVWVNNQQDWPDHYASPEASIFGIFGTTWYHCLELPGVKEFVSNYQKRWSSSAIRVPGNVYYNGYMAMRELLSAVERVGNTNNHAVIRELENLKITAASRMQHADAYMDASSHHLQQAVYIATSNDKENLKNDSDFYKILNWLAPEDIRDPGEQQCNLESMEDTPVYEI